MPVPHFSFTERFRKLMQEIPLKEVVPSLDPSDPDLHKVVFFLVTRAGGWNEMPLDRESPDYVLLPDQASSETLKSYREILMIAELRRAMDIPEGEHEQEVTIKSLKEAYRGMRIPSHIAEELAQRDDRIITIAINEVRNFLEQDRELSR